MSPHSGILSWFRDNRTFLFFFNIVCLSEKQQIFDLTWPGLEPRSITLEVSTRMLNQYTMDAVKRAQINNYSTDVGFNTRIIRLFGIVTIFVNIMKC